MKCSKNRYRKKAAAEDAGRSAVRRGMAGFKVYRCPKCRCDDGARAWHVTHGVPRRHSMPGIRRA